MRNEMDLSRAIATLEDHGDCGCSLCQWAKRVIEDNKDSEEMALRIGFKIRKQEREKE